VLSVLLSFFFWPLCCLSFCPVSFGHCVVCPSRIMIILLVSSNLLTMRSYLIDVVLISCSYFILCVTTSKRSHSNSKFLALLQNVFVVALFNLVVFGGPLISVSLFVLLSFFFWPLCCLSFCHFSFGHCVVCPFVIFLLAIVFTRRATLPSFPHRD
jgi:hypothetical protein